MIRLFAVLIVLTGVLATSAADTVKINGREAHPTRVLAKFKKKGNAAAAAAAGITVYRQYSQIPGLATVEVAGVAALKAAVAGDPDPAAALKATIKTMEASGLFAYVEPDYLGSADLAPTDRAYLDGRLWGLKNAGQQGGAVGADINVEQAWDISTGDTNVVIGVIDTGVNYNHRDLKTQMWVNPGEIPGNGVDDDGDGYVDDVYGINAIADSGDPLDDNGHGSHCAGTIGAAANNGFDHVGVMWNVKIVAMKWLGADGFGFFSDAITCINYSIVKKIRITSNSWGGTGYSQALYDAIAAARASGQLFVAAAGNDGVNNDVTPHYPAAFSLDNILAVAALDRFDNLADFSNFGITTTDIGAPGVDIFSTWMGSDTAYNTISGTSMATPHVAGVAGLVLAHRPGLDFASIKNKLLTTAVKIPALNGKVSSGGRVNAFAALSGTVDGILEITVFPGSGSYFLTNTAAIIQVHVTDDVNVNNATVSGRFNNQTITFFNGSGIDTNGNDGIYTAQVTIPGTPGFNDLSLSISAPGKQSTNLVVTYESVAPPVNDNFENATKIPPVGGIVAGDNRLATLQPGEPLHAGVPNARSLWWSWSSPTATPVIVDTAGTSFDDDAALAVYTGPSLTSLNLVGSALASANGPNGTRAPFVKFDASPSITYWIAVAQTANGTNSPGRVSLRVEPRGELDTTPPTLKVTNYVSGISIRSSTNSIILSGIAFDPPPSASGIRENDGVQYKVNDDLLFQSAIGSSNWMTSPIILVAGVNHVYLKSFDRADNESALVDFTLFYSAQTNSNDLFGYATSILDTVGTLVATNTAATKEFGEPAHAGNEGGKSLWWKFVAPADGNLVLSTEGSTFDTLLALYSVNDPNARLLSDLRLVAEDDDSPGTTTGFSELFATLTRGTTYYIAVDGYAGQSGVAELQYNFTPSDVYPITVSYGPGGTVTPTSKSFPAFSAVTVRALPDPYKQLAQFVVVSNGQTNIATTNPYTFLLSGPTTVTATFMDKVFTDDFEDGFGLPYNIATVGPLVTWTVDTVATNAPDQAVRTTKAAVAKGLGNNQAAVMSLTTNLLAGIGSFEFGINTETNYDVFSFRIIVDGAAVRTWNWSGYIPWTKLEFDIPVSSNPITLEWRYTKDPALTVDNELVAIDNLDIPIAPSAPPLTDVQLSVSSTPTAITITATGQPNHDFTLYSSSDLVNWQPVSGAEKPSGATGVATFTITPAASAGSHFYIVRED